MFEKFIGKLKDIDKELIYIVLYYIIIALFVNIIASSIVNSTYNLLFIISTILLVLVIVYIIYRQYVQLRFEYKKIACVIAYDPYDREIIPINRYSYSTVLNLYLDALFAENVKDLQDFKKSDISKINNKAPDTFAKKVLDDATEYILLNLLSNKVNEYYNSIYKKKIQKYTNETLYKNLNHNIFRHYALDIG